MELVSERLLAEWVQDYLPHVLGRPKSTFRHFCDLTYGMASTYLMEIMGQEWWNDRLSPSSRGRARSFLRFDSTDTVDGSRNSERVEALASGLMNLQYVEGYDTLLKRLATADLETTHAEVRVPDLLIGSGRSIRFNPPRGEKGADYDIELTLPGQVKLAAEIKCKIEDSAPGRNGLVAALRSITDQCPASHPCVGFVCLPEHWDLTGDFAKDLQAAISNVFRMTKQLWMVCIIWERYLIVDDDNAGCARTIWHFRNPRVEGPSLLDNLVQSPLSWMYNPQWRSWHARILGYLQESSEGRVFADKVRAEHLIRFLQ
jgi:hypothetical protein